MKNKIHGKKIFSIIFLLFALYQPPLGAQTLSPAAEVSIITFGPGREELYAAFGHSAIRVQDPLNGFDVAYNYGTFDFNQPHFYLNFARGYMIYMLSIEDFGRMQAYYRYYHRSITEQVLRLTPAQKQKVFDYLQHNARPENASYYYDYFYDNCATKIGDVFRLALADEFRFDSSFVDEPGLTIRTLTDRYTAAYFPWGKLGIDLCLGLPMDKQLSNMEYTFLPDYVFKAFAKASIKINGRWQPVVREVRQLYIPPESKENKPWLTPHLVFWSFFVVIGLLSLYAYRRHKSLRWFDFIWFFTLGLLGVFLLLLWLATNHKAAAWNLNLLWAWPSHLVISFLLLKRKLPRWVNWYLLFTAIVGVILMLAWPWLPQALNTALIPLVLLTVMRSLFTIVQE